MAASLHEVLTARTLRAMAGPAFVRGEAYFREGRVESWGLTEDAIVGVVLGGERYHVRLRASSGLLLADCTCPVGGPICKHAVAVGLACLEQPDARPAPIADGRSFATRAELEAWATQHQVRHALWQSAEVVLPKLPPAEVQRYGLRYPLGRLSLRDVGSRDSVSRHIGVHSLEAMIAEAARGELEQAAAIVRAGQAEEAERPAAHPEVAVAPLWSRLVELRGELRVYASPRSRAFRASGTWRFDAPGAAVQWKEPGRVMRSPYDAGMIAITAQLTMTGDGEPRLECTCPAERARCTHSLALIDATLDVLADPARAGEAGAIAHELMRPGWARLLQELDQLEARAARPRAVVEVWWQLGRELGALTLSPLVKKQLKNGALSAGTRPTAARMLDEHRDSLAEIDVRIAEHVAAWTPPARGAPPARGTSYPVRAFLALVGHPRVIPEWSDRPIEVARVALGFAARERGDHIYLEPSLGGEACEPARIAALLAAFGPGEPLVLEQPERQRCLIIDVHDDAHRLWTLLAKHGHAFPPEGHAPLLDRLARLESRLPVAVPRALKGEELPCEPSTVLRLRLLPDAALELELLVRPGPGAPLFQPGAGPRDVLLRHGGKDGERGYVRRQLLAEPARSRAMLAGLALETAEEGPPFCYRIGEPDRALELVAALQTPPPGLEVEWLDAPPRIAGTIGAEALRVHVERRRDWFGIVGEVKVETGRLELAVLLDAARRQRRFVRVDDGRWARLSDALRERLLAVADQTFAAKHRLELSPGAVPAIRALADAGAEVVCAPDWQRLTERLAASAQLAPRPPAALTATLRDYQLVGHAWLSRGAAWGAGAGLADDMGLGKTVQAIAVLLDRARLGPALVLAPTSVALNWAAELARFAPGLRPVVYAETADRAACLTKLRKKDVVIASYGLLVRDAELFARTSFATLVLDEAQALKNANTQRARAARKLDAQFRIALSGTPFENHLGELWSVFAIIFPGLLGSWEQFRERFAGPIERSKDAETRAALSRVLRPFLLRRTKQEVARELPARTEIEVPVALSKEEWELYEDARLAAVAELDRQGKGVRNEQQRFAVLAALTRLRLLACHPRLYDGTSEVGSSKLRRLCELLDELRREGHRALVFSQFTSHLALVQDALEHAGHRWLYLDGATPARERKARIAAFQAGRADVFLISLKAGGTGINLTAADYVIHLDPWWNPAVEDQATDRAHRIGQTRPVTVYRLIARGTIEEKIVSLHGDKRALVSGVLDGTDVAGRLSTQDLLALLSAAPHAGGADDDDRAEAADQRSLSDSSIVRNAAVLASTVDLAPTSLK